MSQEQIIAGRYEVTRLLGEGGFARVYAATDIEMGRPVAVKILKPELLGHKHVREAFFERFSREVNIAASLEHPHLVPVYDTGMVRDEYGNERPFLVMKMLEGKDLETLLKEGNDLSFEMVHCIGAQMLDALAFVHEQGVVHKDLKPANLFLSTDRRGEPHLYVMDFGIAHDPRSGAPRMTQTGTFSGTMQYLAPEYLLDKLAGPHVDVYQAGLILAELLSGKAMLPLETTMPDLIARYIRCEPVELPEALSRTRAGAVLNKAIRFDWQERYQDAEQFFLAWEALTLSDFPTSPGIIEAPIEPSGEMASPGSEREARTSLPAVLTRSVDQSLDDLSGKFDKRNLVLAAFAVFALILLSGGAVFSLLEAGEGHVVEIQDVAAASLPDELHGTREGASPLHGVSGDNQGIIKEQSGSHTPLGTSGRAPPTTTKDTGVKARADMAPSADQAKKREELTTKEVARAPRSTKKRAKSKRVKERAEVNAPLIEPALHTTGSSPQDAPDVRPATTLPPEF